MDADKHQELLDKYQRGLDNYEHLNQAKHLKHAQDLKARLAARRTRRAAEIQRSEEEKLLLKKREEEERMIREMEEKRREEEKRKEEDGGIMIPHINITEGHEVQALAREQERQQAENETEKLAEVERLN
uniref:Uncharacterized protein n=3 Tax=Ciona intestinalis TaxID=7719 RepID=F6YWA0_CIOIN